MHIVLKKAKVTTVIVVRAEELALSILGCHKRLLRAAIDGVRDELRIAVTEALLATAAKKQYPFVGNH